MHIVLGSYNCDNQESEDLLAVKRRDQINYSIYRCLLFKSDMNISKIRNSHTVQHTLKMLDVLNCSKNAGREMLN